MSEIGWKTESPCSCEKTGKPPDFGLAGWHAFQEHMGRLSHIYRLLRHRRSKPLRGFSVARLATLFLRTAFIGGVLDLARVFRRARNISDHRRLATLWFGARGSRDAD